MNEKNKKPQIRFAGFTDDWEQRKLGEIYGKIRNAFVGTATPYYVDQGYFYLESNNVKNGQINRNTEVFINEAFYYAQRDKWLKENDLVMVQSGHVGHTAVIPKELDNTAAHALITFSDYQENTDPHFLNYFFQTTLAKLEIEKITTGNTIKHILSSDMKEFQINIPKYEEQTAIGNFFKQLDETIALHQREYEKYKNLKISYLEKMFPKENEQFPELRFPEFTDAWEQRKLGEIGTTFSGLTGKSKDDFGYGKAKYITYLNVYSNCLTSDKTLDLIEIDNTQNQVQKGDVFFTTSSETPDEVGLSSVWTYDIPNVYLNSFCFGYRPNEKIDLNYLAYMLRSENVRNQMILLAQGISRYNISKKSVMEIDVYLPKLEEQTTIGNFFKQLDETIALHQRKAEKYKQIKQAYLEKMFV